MRDSVFLKDSAPQEEPGCCACCCKCFSLDYYKDYFKVTNDIVKKRVMCNVKFWSGGFFDNLKEDYDLYQPIYLDMGHSGSMPLWCFSAVQSIIFCDTKQMQAPLPIVLVQLVLVWVFSSSLEWQCQVSMDFSSDAWD